MTMIEMRIVGVRVEMPNQQPILMLAETVGPRSLPILIGSGEATAIAMHLQGIRPPRPLTHDLLARRDHRRRSHPDPGPGGRLP